MKWNLLAQAKTVRDDAYSVYNHIGNICQISSVANLNRNELQRAQDLLTVKSDIKDASIYIEKVVVGLRELERMVNSNGEKEEKNERFQHEPSGNDRGEKEVEDGVVSPVKSAR